MTTSSDDLRAIEDLGPCLAADLEQPVEDATLVLIRYHGLHRRTWWLSKGVLLILIGLIGASVWAGSWQSSSAVSLTGRIIASSIGLGVFMYVLRRLLSRKQAPFDMLLLWHAYEALKSLNAYDESLKCAFLVSAREHLRVALQPKEWSYVAFGEYMDRYSFFSAIADLAGVDRDMLFWRTRTWDGRHDWNRLGQDDEEVSKALLLLTVGLDAVKVGDRGATLLRRSAENLIRLVIRGTVMNPRGSLLPAIANKKQELIDATARTCECIHAVALVMWSDAQQSQARETKHRDSAAAMPSAVAVMAVAALPSILLHLVLRALSVEAADASTVSTIAAMVTMGVVTEYYRRRGLPSIDPVATQNALTIDGIPADPGEQPAGRSPAGNDEA
ncbi:MAG: hypothetical protein ABFD96_00995 [Armatimonadia bacterium]